MSGLKHVYTERSGDTGIIVDYYNAFLLKSHEELIEAYNAQLRCGITGVHRQALFLIAMEQAFMDRFGKSPFEGDGRILGLKSPVCLSGDSFVHLKNDSDEG